MIKKIISRGISAVLALLTILSLMLAVSIMIGKSRGIPQIFGYSFMRIVTGSMEPVIKTGSVIFVKNCGAEDIQEQDIITFYSADPEIEGMIVTHRVVGISMINGEHLFTTRGDANNKNDDYAVGNEALIGKVQFISERFGSIFGLLTKPGVYIILVIIPLGLMLILNMIRVAEVVREDDDEEEDETEEGTDEVPETEEKQLPGSDVREEKEEQEEKKNRKAKKEDKKTADRSEGSEGKNKNSSGKNAGKDVKKKKFAGDQNIYHFKSYYTKKKKKRKGKNGKIKKKR